MRARIREIITRSRGRDQVQSITVPQKGGSLLGEQRGTRVRFAVARGASPCAESRGEALGEGMEFLPHNKAARGCS